MASIVLGWLAAGHVWGLRCGFPSLNSAQQHSQEHHVGRFYRVCAVLGMTSEHCPFDSAAPSSLPLEATLESVMIFVQAVGVLCGSCSFTLARHPVSAKQSALVCSQNFATRCCCRGLFARKCDKGSGTCSEWWDANFDVWDFHSDHMVKEVALIGSCIILCADGSLNQEGFVAHRAGRRRWRLPKPSAMQWIANMDPTSFHEINDLNHK